MPGAHDLGATIDAAALAASLTNEELAAKADELVLSMGDPTALLAKPCSTLIEAPEVLTCFGMLLGALAPLPGMTVLDFGAGSCWTSHYLAQLGCRVIAMDLSKAMLDLGRRRFESHPVFGDRPEPTFVAFDGEHMELQDQSVDRILCFDALHHVANPSQVIAEMARVLRPGGSAGFHEAGPRHSLSAQAQHEMRRYGVPELDIVLEDIWSFAQSAGFAELSVGIFSPVPIWVNLEEFSSFLGESGQTDAESRRGRTHRSLATIAQWASSRSERLARKVGFALQAILDAQRISASRSYLSFMTAVLENRRMFIMRMPGVERSDSREASGLSCEITLQDVHISRNNGATGVSGTCRIKNTGRNYWLASSVGQGAVLLGLRVGRPGSPAADHGRIALPAQSGVAPGEEVAVSFATEVADQESEQGPVHLELDLVSEGIIWFANVGAPPLEIELPPAR